MENNKHILLRISIILAFLICISTRLWSEPEPDKWDTAGKEISEAAKAVGKASEESWRKTEEKTAEVAQGVKEKGTEAWDKTKKKSSELAEKTGEISTNVAVETAEQSKGFWLKIKETLKKWYAKTKARIHAITAPDRQQ